MALEDLADLGFQVFRAPEGAAPGDSVYGFGRQWVVMPNEDEEAVVAEATNHKALADKLEQAQAYFAGTYANWPSMTAGQKDTAMRNAQRALANLIRHVRNDLTSEGV
jgi:hypothetical protein